jgi:hypothetical protein
MDQLRDQTATAIHPQIFADYKQRQATKYGPRITPFDKLRASSHQRKPTTTGTATAHFNHGLPRILTDKTDNDRGNPSSDNAYTNPATKIAKKTHDTDLREYRARILNTKARRHKEEQQTWGHQKSTNKAG